MAAASSNQEIPLVDNLGNLLNEIKEEKQKYDKDKIAKDITLVAVSKTKPLSMIKELYDSKYKHRHFGENYVTGNNALYEKAIELSKDTNYNDIKWHFIGHIQSNDIPKLVSVPNLYIIETLDKQKHCQKLNKRYKDHIDKLNNDNKDSNDKIESKLRVMVQVKSPMKDKTGKDTKSGIEYPDSGTGNESKDENESKSDNNGSKTFAVGDLVKYIINDCPALQFSGLMTMGRDENEPKDDFMNLVRCREQLWQYLNDDKQNIKHNLETIDSIGLSMGMTGDWKEALECGSTNLRVGSKIFGARVYN